jgi:hypothetical protein
MTFNLLDADQREEAVEYQTHVERIRREARRRVDAEERPAAARPAFETLRQRLAKPQPVVLERIEALPPKDSRVMLTAQYKAGKTTLVGNLVKALADNEPFLDRYSVAPIDGSIVVLDFEMSERQLVGWMGAHRIRNDDRVIVLPMRGRAAAFDILDDRKRSEWAQELKRHRAAYSVLDCVRPVLDALRLDEQHDGGVFLTAFDALLVEAGIPDALVVHHMGHTNERARGDSRFRDWPDVEWRLVRQGDEPSDPRYLTAYGRDVDVPESQLLYDPVTRRLTIEDGSRRDAVARDALDDVIAFLGHATEPQTGRAVKKGLEDTEHARQALEAALKLGAKTGKIKAESGPRNSRLYSSVPVSRTVPSVSQDSSVQCPSPYRDGTLGHSLIDSPVSQDDYSPEVLAP